jgi:hypothetical protein
MTDPAQHGRRGLALLRRLAVGMLRIGRTRRLALPPPQAPSPAAPAEAPAVIVLPADPAATGEPTKPETEPPASAPADPPPVIVLPADPAATGEPPKPEPEPAASAPTDAPAVIVLPADPATTGEPPKPEPAAPPPCRPPDPARRAKYFAAPYVTPSPPILRLARPTPASAETTLPIAAAPETLPLAGLATATTPLSGAPPGVIDCIEPIRFSAFAVWHPEAAQEVPPDATAAWLLEPVLLARAVRLRDAVLHNYAAGGAPLHPVALLEASLRIAGHAATALLLCLTVTRTFARGGEAVAWRVVDRRSGAFSDGVQTHLPVPRHPDGVVQPDSADRPGLFYLLLAAAALGTADSGDWYRFFALATLAAFTAATGCAPPRPLSDGPALHLAWQVDAAQAALRDPAQAELPAYRAWLWANALSFVEWSNWGRSQSRADAAARGGIDAARFGLAAAGFAIDSSWRWSVPVAGALRNGRAAPAACIAEWLPSANGRAA